MSSGDVGTGSPHGMDGKAARSAAMSGWHRIVEARVIPWPGGVFGVLYRFDSGWLDAHKVGSREAAERATRRIGELQPIPGYTPKGRIHPTFVPLRSVVKKAS